MHSLAYRERTYVYVSVSRVAEIEIFGNFGFYYPFVIDDYFENATFALFSCGYGKRIIVVVRSVYEILNPIFGF